MALRAAPSRDFASVALLAIVLLFPGAAAVTRGSLASQGAKCPAHKDPDMKVVRKQMERLVVGKDLPDGAGKGQVTLLTHGTWDRVAGLKLTLRNWDGPVSVAFFAKTQQDVLNIRKFVKARTWAPGSSVSLAYAKTKYPINFLRNVALDGARTEWVFPIDMDFTPSINASKVMAKHLPKDEKGILVLPAFELDDGPYARMKRIMNDQDVDGDSPPLTKSLLLKAGTKVFHDQWAPAHDATDSARWKRESGGTYPIDVGKYVHESYEPYVVVRRNGLPHYDERFDGYGYNKVQWILCLRCSRYKFNVVEDAFVLHVEHKKQHKSFRKSSNRKMESVMENFVRALKCPYDIKPREDAHLF